MVSEENLEPEEMYAEIMRLPQAPIDRVIKECMPANIHASKETRQAFARAVAVFVLCLGTAASDIARAAKRKAVGVKDVKQALKVMKLDMPEMDILVERFMQNLEKEEASNDEGISAQ